MRRKSRPRNPLFAKRWFSDDVIILCVRWYLHFQLSYRDLAEIAWELGVLVAPPSTILRWVVRYATEFEHCWRKFELRVGRSWRADETYIKTIYEASGCICIVLWMSGAELWSRT